MRTPLRLNCFLHRVILMTGLLVASIATSYAVFPGRLKTSIQKTIDSDSLLKKRQVVLRVANEERGRVTIEMMSGPQNLKYKVISCDDILNPQSETATKLLEQEEMGVDAIRQTVDRIRGMEGVESVELVAKVHLPPDAPADLFDPRAYPENMRDELEKAKRGDAEAQTHIGFAFYKFVGAKHDGARAVAWYKLAAEQGLDYAQFNMGIMYMHGDGVAKDEAKAVQYFQIAAKQELSGAEVLLAEMYGNGKGVPKDESEAIAWLRRAAEHGFPRAQIRLATHYASGKWVEKDDAKAAYWLHRAAKSGFDEAQNDLGSVFENGEGVDKDMEKAVLWYNKSAEQGNLEASNSLAWIYATCDDPKHLDGKKAVEYGLKSTSKEPVRWDNYDTLAAAYARDGQFDKAMETSLKGIDLLRSDKVLSAEDKNKKLKEVQERSDLYKKRQPYTDHRKK